MITQNTFYFINKKMSVFFSQKKGGPYLELYCRYFSVGKKKDLIWNYTELLNSSSVSLIRF